MRPIEATTDSSSSDEHDERTTSKLHYSILQSGQFYKWFKQSSAYHQTRSEWLWKIEDRQEVPSKAYVRIPDFIIQAAKVGSPEVLDDQGNMIQAATMDVPELRRQGSIIEAGTARIPATKSMRTLIMENEKLTDEEKLHKFDSERRA